MKTYPLYINGEFISGSLSSRVISPATQEVIAEVSLAQEKEVELALASARAGFDSGHWPRLPLERRRNYLLNIARGILENAAELARIETENTGKPIKESTFMDIPSAAKAFEYIGRNFEKFLQEEAPLLEEEARCQLLREPLGVAVLIVPWNYPFLIACWKLAFSLAAGNTVILKPSSLTPLSVLELAKIIHQADLPKGAVNIINASGDSVGRQLCADRRVDMISFTGSNEVGRKIIESSSLNVKKLIMELGGKSASIILADADLEVAVNGSLSSIFLNQGQMCTAMSRLLVEDKIYERFLADFINKAKRIKLGKGGDFQTQMGPLVSEAQRKKVLSLVERAKKEGAKVLCGGRIPEDASLKKGFFFEPTVITGITPDKSVFQEEIFGPVVFISKFSSSEEAVDLANNSCFGLAACIWSKDSLKAENLAQKINAGTIWINTYGMFFPQVPYGGFKQSGFGKELGRQGFLEYTRLKNLIIDQSQDAKPLVNYWYGF